MKSILALAAAVLFVSSAASAADMEQGTKDRISAYVRVNIALFTNEACMFVSEDERSDFLDAVAGNVIGLREELGTTVTSPTTAKAFLKLLQGQAMKQVQESSMVCDPEDETTVREGIMEAAAINESIAAHGPYIDPRRR